MNVYDEAIKVMNNQLGHDEVIALASEYENGVHVRMCNGYYENGSIYVVTYRGTNKIKDLSFNKHVAIAHDLMNLEGVGEDIGHPLKPGNEKIRNKLVDVFCKFYELHVDELDSKTCILKIKLTKGIAFANDKKYYIDFESHFAKYEDFVTNLIK